MTSIVSGQFDVLFVTGTDTDVGKTIAVAALAVCADVAGAQPRVLKPAQTGVGPGEPGDLEVIAALTGVTTLHEGTRLPDPLAPTAAARLAGATLPPLGSQRAHIAAHAEGGLAIVEGSGGLLVPLGDGWDLADLAAAVAAQGLRVGVVVVARAGLGTLNHSALTVEALRRRGLAVAGLIIGSWPRRPDLAEEQNLRDLPELTGVRLLGRIPEGAGALGSDRFRAGALSWLDL